MKKILGFMIAAGLLLAGATGAFAGSYIHNGKISLTDAKTEKTRTYEAVDMVVNGKAVVTDIPAILFVEGGQTRTLVPVRFIADTLGAEVSWDNVTKEATIVLKNKVIVLKAESATALVDGAHYTLPDKVPVKLMGADYNYRTLVPVRFVAEQLGMEVGWIQDIRTVTISKPLPAVKSVAFNGDNKHPELIFKTTDEVTFTSRFLSAEETGTFDQLVLDMSDTLFALEDKSSIDANGTSRLPVSPRDILYVEGAQVGVVPYNTRFIIHMEREIPYKAEYDAESKELRVAFSERIREPEPEPDEPDEPAIDDRPSGQRLIVIDAGHGGNDPGATSPFSRTTEKELNLIIAKKLERRLKALDYKVVMTRTDDTLIGLYDRAGRANALGADVFLSIHFNASTKQDPNGIEMLYVPDGRDSQNFAQLLQNEVVKATGATSIGLIERPNLVVIRETQMPAVLAELGFLTNPTEEQRILMDGYQESLVEGMVNAILKYVK